MPEKKKRQVKKVESVRERTARKAEEPKGGGKTKRVVKAASQPINKASKLGRKEYHPIKLPDNKVGRLLNKRVRFIPSYLVNAWAEIRMVEWPNARETTKLTTAVIIFAVVFGALVYALDYGLDKIFQELLLG